MISDDRRDSGPRLTNDAENDWHLFARHIDLAEGFWLGFLFLKSPPAGAIFLERLKSLPKSTAIPPILLAAKAPEDFNHILANILSATPDDALVWCVVEGLDEPERRKALSFAAQRWNERREVLRRGRKSGLLFVVPSWAKPLIREAAPDLWSIRDIVLEPDTELPEGYFALTQPHEPHRLHPDEAIEVSSAERELAIQHWHRVQRTADDPSRRWLSQIDALKNLVQARVFDLAQEAADSVRDTDPPEQRLTTIDPALLARSLFNWSSALGQLGRLEEAHSAIERATAIRRELAQKDPEVFLLDLAASLNNLGNMLSELGRRDRALEAVVEAVELYRALAKDRPDVFLSNLASSLNNLGKVLSDMGRKEQALEATHEAVEINRVLTKDNSDAFLPSLALGLNNLSADLSDLGRREQAFEAVNEAVQIRRALANDSPDVFLPHLAASLNNLGALLNLLGRREQAFEAVNEAVQIRRDFAKDRPDVFLPDLARSLGLSGLILMGLGRRGEAVAALAEAQDRLWPYFELYPGAFGELLGAIFSQLRAALGEMEPGPEVIERMERITHWQQVEAKG